MITRLWTSPVVWSWAFNALRFASGILLLPLLLRLPEPDFGFYWILLNLAAMVPLLDMGFAASIDRAIGYAMSGTSELKAKGMVSHDSSGGTKGPNHVLLWRLITATRSLYRILSIGVLLILGSWGTFVVSLRVDETSSSQLTWFAWSLTLLSGILEMYSGWWNVVLRGLNQVLPATRILVLSYSAKFFLSIILLSSGAGLLSVPIAGFISSFLQRALSRRLTLKLLSKEPAPTPDSNETIKLIKILWPNSWRTGCHHLSIYLTTSVSTYLCMKHLGLTASGQYGLSLQVVSICQSMSQVWIQVKWPFIFQLRSRNALNELRQIARPRIILLYASYFLLASLAAGVGPVILDWLNQNSWTQTSKSLIPLIWLVPLLMNGFFETQFSTWGMFIFAENRIPYLWPIVIGNFVALLVMIALLQLTTWGIGAFVLAPLLVGSLFNYWYWPAYSARLIGSRFDRFFFGK